MTINSYLTNIAKTAIIKDQEKEKIRLSILALEYRLDEYFNNSISDKYIFGSYRRGTILPRKMDSKSDVDYLIIFSDRTFKPQTYLDWLTGFVEKNYPKSEIYQSNPTIVLTLNHIRFELVPAIRYPLYGLQIPAKASAYQDWIGTDPVGFNSTLTDANKTHKNLIKPLVRVVKFWNSQNGSPFESFTLENYIVQHGFWTRWIFGGQLKDYFFDFMENLDVGFFAPAWKKEAIKRTKLLITTAKEFEENSDQTRAENELEKMFLMY